MVIKLNNMKRYHELLGSTKRKYSEKHVNVIITYYRFTVSDDCSMYGSVWEIHIRFMQIT